jgi:hypothetical protein
MSLRRRRDPQYLTLTTAKNGTFTASITRIAGAPECVWKFADGDEQIGNSCSKALDGSEQKVICKIVPRWIATADLDATVTHIDHLRKCFSLTSLSAHFEAWDVRVFDLPSGLKIASVYAGSIAGDLSEFPASVTRLDLWFCSLVTGSQISHMRGIDYVDLSNQSATQSRINAIIDDIYTHRANFTYASGIACNLDGNNAAPIGNVIPPEEGSDWHQEGATWIPLTAGAKVFDLVNDVNSEGFNFWNITVT